MAARYAVAAGGNWGTDATWSTTDGGAPDTVKPTAADDVYLTANSGNIVVNVASVCRSLNCTGFTGDFTISASTALSIGDGTAGAGNIALKYSSAMTSSLASATRTINFVSTSATQQTIDTLGKTLCNITINGAGSSYLLSSTMTLFTNCVFNLTAGTFNDGNYDVTAAEIWITGSTARTLTKGTGTWSATTTLASKKSWDATTTTNLTFTDAGTISISTASTNLRNFAGGGLTYGTLTYTVAGSTAGLDITGSNTFSTINFSDASNARSLRFTAGTTTTVGTFNVQGTSGKLMTVDSITAATHTLTKSSGVVSCDYLSVKNSVAQGGAAWYAGANSTSVSGNTGWLFTAPATAALTGTVTTATETDIVTGGKTIILTLTNDTWVASGATFDAQRQNIINGLDSAQSETGGWDAVVKAGLSVTDVVRTDNTTVTITLPAFASYAITANETITCIIPDTALTNGEPITASPTFTITNEIIAGVIANTYSPQQCFNKIYGTTDYQLTMQDIANLVNGTQNLSVQEIINNRAGRQPTSMSVHESIFTNVKTALSLSDPYTKYSLQEILNMCVANSVNITTLLG